MATSRATTPKLYAVLTGDLINSSKRKPTERKQLVESLNKLFDQYKFKTRNDLKIKATFELYRGDSFQAITETPSQALLLALLIRTFLQGIVVFPGQSTKNDARIAIGIGRISYKATSLAKSDGEAFLFSGRTLDGMKKLPNRIALKSVDEKFDGPLELNLVLLEGIINRWTVAQAEIVYFKLQGFTEIAIAKQLEIRQPTVNERSKLASWIAVERLLNSYQTLATKAFPT